MRIDLRRTVAPLSDECPPLYRPRMRQLVLPTVFCALAVGLAACQKPNDASAAKTADADAGEGKAKRPPPTKAPSALPAQRPTPFEAEYRIRFGKTKASTMIRATDKGARYSLGDEEHRVIVSYDIDATLLDDVYGALRDASFDRVETQATRQLQQGGTSMSIVAGTQRHSASDMGRIYPKEHWAAEYDAAAKAMESLLPPRPGASVKAQLAVRWDASMKGHRATLDAELGGRFAGAESIDDTGANARIGLTDAAPVVVTLRHGPPAAEDDVTYDPAQHAAVIVSFDAETSRPVAKLVDAAGLNAWDAAASAAPKDAPPPAKSPAGDK